MKEFPYSWLNRQVQPFEEFSTEKSVYASAHYRKWQLKDVEENKTFLVRIMSWSKY